MKVILTGANGYIGQRLLPLLVEVGLEFEVIANENKKGGVLKQKATFRPNGLLGRFYWYSIHPFHWFVFVGLARGIIQHAEGDK